MKTVLNRINVMANKLRSPQWWFPVIAIMFLGGVFSFTCMWFIAAATASMGEKIIIGFVSIFVLRWFLYPLAAIIVAIRNLARN